jgi:hypothetical protein
MKITQTVAQILNSHVTLEVECIDRMYLNLYVPGLQHLNGVVGFLRNHRRQPITSTALIAPISNQKICDGLSAERIDRFCRKRLRLLPHPFPASDRKAGYRYALSILHTSKPRPSRIW